MTTGDVMNLRKHGDAAAEVGQPAGERWLLLLGGPAAGALLGYLVTLLADWVTRLPSAPFGSWFELIAGANGRWGPWAVVGVGLLVGLGGGLFAVAMGAKVTFDGPEVRIVQDGEEATVAAAAIDVVFAAGKNLVVLDAGTRQLFRGRCELPAARLAAAFTAHGHRWLPADPHADAYHRWIPGAPELPAAVNAVLRARKSALEKKDAADALELREEAERLGYVVRDEGTRQHWRELAS
ncbi:YqeB family protein [Streptomyces boninensis]|uniref:YqeB family protein n=1 Tax=Streptomyces boninensis TaxID=2039455 RepID=UPI003B224D8A